MGALRLMATTHPNEIRPIYFVQTINGHVDRSYFFGGYAAKAQRLSEALATLGDKSKPDDCTDSTQAQDMDLPLLRRNAAYALSAIRTKEALAALVALLDSDDAEVAGLALNGICLFVRNTPVVTPSSVPAFS